MLSASTGPNTQGLTDTMRTKNIITKTDSYKLSHWKQYPTNTEGVYSYFESRVGAKYPYTVFFGLQYILQEFMEGQVVTPANLDYAKTLSQAHFGRPMFNEAGWQHIIDKHDGKLPLRIKAVPEGTPVPVGNVTMTVENTDPECFWLTNALESLLTHVWYSSNVATISRIVKQDIAGFLNQWGDGVGPLPFMLHDFGYRGASTDEAAAIGGAGHLVNFQGTDTLVAMELAVDYYNADLETLAFSVPATEHSVMTALGRKGEYNQALRIMRDNPTGIISEVADSYNIYDFVDQVGTTWRDEILARDGVFVIRPDSVTTSHRTPEALVVNILQTLDHHLYGFMQRNSKGKRLLPPQIRVLWGDGLDPDQIHNILSNVVAYGYAPENIATFGMGGGLLQKHDRDTQRNAFKSSSQKRDGEWHDVWKDPVDSTKKSKRGRLALYRHDGEIKTVREQDAGWYNILDTVFENGVMTKYQTFDQVRANAALA
jgi:nicotinamide phosphoribosyltransferase